MTILDFIITTFTNPNADVQSQAQTSPTPAASILDSDELATTNEQVAKIDVKVNLHGIILLLNDDGIKIATTKLDSAFVTVLWSLNQ